MSKRPSQTRARRRAEHRATAKRVAVGTGGVLALGAGLVTAAPASAGGPTVVTNTDDAGAGSLRDAIDNASDGDTITFDPSLDGGTITLASTITIDDQITITGPGDDLLTVDGDLRQIFYISGAADAVSISGLRFVGGYDDFGGAIGSLSDLTLDDTTFYDNEVDGDGGAVAIDGADLAVSGSVFDANEASDSGGGAAVLGGQVTIADTTFSGNEAGIYDGGGGLFLDQSGGTITGSTFDSNTNDNGRGGGLFSEENTMPLSITSTTFADNEISGDGAGAFIRENGAQVTVTGSTFTGNLAGSDGGGVTFADNEADVTVTGSTFTGNSNPSDQGGGIFVYDNSADITVTIESSTVTGNSAGRGGGIAFIDEDGPDGSVRVVDSTIAANEADNGAGFYSDGGVSVIERTTISGNTAEVVGGGVHADNGAQITLTNSTISGNDAGYIGGGVYLYYAAPSTISHSTITDNSAGRYGSGVGAYESDLTIDHTIVSGNTGSAADLSTYGSDTDVTNSIVGESDTAGGGAINDVGGNNQFDVADPELGPLADNGGATQTHAVEPGTIAFDAGDPAFAAPPDTDQRGSGFARVSYDAIDVGAYEAQQPPPDTPTTTTTAPGDDVADDAVTDAPAATPTVANPTFTG